MHGSLSQTADALMRHDLCPFIYRTFSEVRAGERLKMNWHIQAMAFHLQNVVEGRTRRLIINVPPRSLKSVCASVALPAWYLGRDPSRQVACASYGESLSTEFHNHTRQVVRAPWFKRAFPRFQLHGGKNTEVEFKTTLGGGRFATSVGGVFTGRGADLIIIDDPLKPDDARSEAARTSARNWFNGTVLSRLNDKSVGAIVLVMQRLHMDDLAGHLLEQGGWTHLNLPAIAEEEMSVQIGESRYHVRKTGELLHAERDTADVLAEMKRSIGTHDFEAQYQQRPVPLDGGLIKWSWFRRFASPPAVTYDDQIVQSWDTAAKCGQLNDFSVCSTWLIQGNCYYLLNLHRERLDYPSLKRKVFDLARRDNPHAVLIEDKGSGTQLLQDLSEGGVSAIAITPQGDKIVRASNHSPKIEAGRVLIPEAAPWLTDFQAEVSAFPNSRHDDQVDSMSQFLIWAHEAETSVPRIREL